MEGHMYTYTRNEEKEKICAFDPCQGTEGEKEKEEEQKKRRRSDEMITPKVKIITSRWVEFRIHDFFLFPHRKSHVASYLMKMTSMGSTSYNLPPKMTLKLSLYLISLIVVRKDETSRTNALLSS